MSRDVEGNRVIHRETTAESPHPFASPPPGRQEGKRGVKPPNKNPKRGTNNPVPRLLYSVYTCIFLHCRSPRHLLISVFLFLFFSLLFTVARLMFYSVSAWLLLFHRPPSPVLLFHSVYPCPAFSVLLLHRSLCLSFCSCLFYISHPFPSTFSVFPFYLDSSVSTGFR